MRYIDVFIRYKYGLSNSHCLDYIHYTEQCDLWLENRSNGTLNRDKQILCVSPLIGMGCAAEPLFYHILCDITWDLLQMASVVCGLGYTLDLCRAPYIRL